MNDTGSPRVRTSSARARAIGFAGAAGMEGGGKTVFFTCSVEWPVPGVVPWQRPAFSSTSSDLFVARLFPCPARLYRLCSFCHRCVPPPQEVCLHPAKTAPFAN